MPDPQQLLAARLAQFDLGALRAKFLEQDEMIVIEDFLPAPLLAGLLARLPALEPHVHRNYLPRHKKGGSISRHVLDRQAGEFPELYHAPALNDFLRRLADRPLLSCPADDPHTYALYYYTEPGDHIGWHYDTSYYKGARYTVLIGLVDESSCRLEYQLYKDNPQRETRLEGIALKPGMFVFFNGDRLCHRITPSGPGERRVALTLEYLTDARMNPIGRLVSNWKDAVAYFGVRQVFGAKKPAG
jgi:hypothetical protein